MHQRSSYQAVKVGCHLTLVRLAAVAENAGPRDSSPTPSPRRHSFNHYPLLEDNLPLQPHKGLSRLHPGVGTTPPERHWPRSQGVEAQSALSGKRETSSSGCQEDRNQREVAHRLREDSEGYFDDDDEDFEGALVKAGEFAWFALAGHFTPRRG